MPHGVRDPLQTTHSTSVYPLLMDEVLGLIDKQAGGFRGGSIRRSTVINTGVAGYDIHVMPSL
jgi:hypothetical protein